MDVFAFLAFVVISAVQVATPGPSTVFIVNNALAFGRRRAILALSGDLMAIALLAGLSVAGLGALLTANPLAFLVLSVIGAAYVIWLGWEHLRAAPAPAAADVPSPPSGGGLRLWVQSFGLGISNPKAVLFFAALFPQFIPTDGGAPILALLVLTFVTVKFLVLGGYALAARHIARLLHRPQHARLGRILTGLVFIAFGTLMIWSAVSAHLGGAEAMPKGQSASPCEASATTVCRFDPAGGP